MFHVSAVDLHDASLGRSSGGNFWCSTTMVHTRQFFIKLCTKMSALGANLVWKQFLVLVNHGQHQAILY